MNKCFRFLQDYLVFSLPFVIAAMAWGAFQSDRTGNPALLKFLWQILGWNTVTWFAFLLVFLIGLIFVPSMRDTSMKRLANLKERDEREQLITGRAATATFVSSLSLLILFLFLSAFTFRISNAPVEQTPDGKTKDISISMKVRLFDKPRIEHAPGNIILESKDIPLSKTSIILIFIVWQIVMFNIYSRKQLRQDLQ